MATLSLRMRDDLKRKAQLLAERQGVSLNNYISSIIAASVAQDETLRFFHDRLQDIDLVTLNLRLEILRRTPSPRRRPRLPTTTVVSSMDDGSGRLRDGANHARSGRKPPSQAGTGWFVCSWIHVVRPRPPRALLRRGRQRRVTGGGGRRALLSPVSGMETACSEALRPCLGA